jgi:uncharacterized membrane-anchored protein YitT (DUF2179 family)
MKHLAVSLLCLFIISSFFLAFIPSYRGLLNQSYGPKNKRDIYALIMSTFSHGSPGNFPMSTFSCIVFCSLQSVSEL